MKEGGKKERRMNEGKKEGGEEGRKGKEKACRSLIITLRVGSSLELS